MGVRTIDALLISSLGIQLQPDSTRTHVKSRQEKDVQSNPHCRGGIVYGKLHLTSTCFYTNMVGMSFATSHASVWLSTLPPLLDSRILKSEKPGPPLPEKGILMSMQG